MVATALLHLSEVAERAASVRHHHRHKVADELVAAVVEDLREPCAVRLERPHVIVFIERHALVVDVDIVAQDADRHEAQRIAQTPVAPVVAGALTEIGIAEVAPGVVPTA